jgi:hypothetical protein
MATVSSITVQFMVGQKQTSLDDMPEYTRQRVTGTDDLGHTRSRISADAERNASDKDFSPHFSNRFISVLIIEINRCQHSTLYCHHVLAMKSTVKFFDASSDAKEPWIATGDAEEVKGLRRT